MLIDPKMVELDSMERSMILGAIEVAIKNHKNKMKKSNPEGRAYDDRAGAVARLQDIQTKFRSL